MNRKLNTTLAFGTLIAGFILLTAFSPQTKEAHSEALLFTGIDNNLKRVAFKILDKKCNICHRKKNPFMVFNDKNMSKRAPKIYKMVFVERKMPKGNDIRLSNEEAATLERWLFTQEIF